MGARLEKMGAEMKEEMGARMEKINQKRDAGDEKMKATIEEVNGKMEMMDTKIDKQKDDIFTSLSEKFQKEVEANKNAIEEFRQDVKDLKTNWNIWKILLDEI
ncbi:hypothetical protein Zmor_018460 [Zophobas morio]|uniref:Uncharacterized protein n=1 Tax=Zophobas morio TaxID=2755281 RepID=A0AA38IBL8_9CUCU|nr:hypothetical protein Zmor_018460 [Zophobas morio]